MYPSRYEHLIGWSTPTVGSRAVALADFHREQRRNPVEGGMAGTLKTVQRSLTILEPHVNYGLTARIYPFLVVKGGVVSLFEGVMALITEGSLAVLGVDSGGTSLSGAGVGSEHPQVLGGLLGEAEVVNADGLGCYRVTAMVGSFAPTGRAYRVEAAEVCTLSHLWGEAVMLYPAGLEQHLLWRPSAGGFEAELLTEFLAEFADMHLGEPIEEPPMEDMWVAVADFEDERAAWRALLRLVLQAYEQRRAQVAEQEEARAAEGAAERAAERVAAWAAEFGAERAAEREAEFEAVRTAARAVSFVVGAPGIASVICLPPRLGPMAGPVWRGSLMGVTRMAHYRVLAQFEVESKLPAASAKRGGAGWAPDSDPRRVLGASRVRAGKEFGSAFLPLPSVPVINWVGPRCRPIRQRGVGALLSSVDRVTPLILWIKPRQIIQQVSLLGHELRATVDPEDEEGDDLRWGPQRVIVATTTTLVAAALGYTRRFRRMLFLQQCLFQHMRRYLLVLAHGPMDVRLVGALPRLRTYWRALTRPTEEAFYHPITEELVLDVGVTARQWRRLPTAATAESVLFETFTSLEDSGDLSPDTLPQVQVEFKQVWGKQLRRARQRGLSWHRYRLEWATLICKSTIRHGFQRTRRARSIKKRRCKQLVRQTQYRFWPR